MANVKYKMRITEESGFQEIELGHLIEIWMSGGNKSWLVRKTYFKQAKNLEQHRLVACVIDTILSKSSVFHTFGRLFKV